MMIGLSDFDKQNPVDRSAYLELLVCEELSLKTWIDVCKPFNDMLKYFDPVYRLVFAKWTRNATWYNHSAVHPGFCCLQSSQTKHVTLIPAMSCLNTSASECDYGPMFNVQCKTLKLSCQRSGSGSS